MLRAVGQFLLDSPLTAWLILAAIALGVQLAVDARMGEVAEYFNAWGVLEAIGEWLAGRDPLAVHFLMGQQRMGALALPAGIAILFVQPLVYGGIAMVLVRFVARLLQ